MTVSKTSDNDTIILAIEGFIDTANAPAFESAVDEVVSCTRSLVLDFAKVEYISSSGLRVLLKSHKKMMASNGKMVIKNVCSSVKEVFELTGFLDILTVE